MQGYLLDTNTISVLVNPGHQHHQAARNAVAAIAPGDLKYVSVIALAEIACGLMVAANAGKLTPTMNAALQQAYGYPRLDVTHHTATEYGQLKANVAHPYLKSALKKDRPRWIEDWVDKATGKKLQLDENDLWMCAQARERNLILVTNDSDVKRIADADLSVRINLF